MVARVAALRFVWGKNWGIPLQPMIKLLPSTRYHSTSGTSSRNFTPSIRVFSKELAWAEVKKVDRIKMANRVGLSMDFLGSICIKLLAKILSRNKRFEGKSQSKSSLLGKIKF
jgi:hypothetical protein